jgi:hypothetical protein
MSTPFIGYQQFLENHHRRNKTFYKKCYNLHKNGEKLFLNACENIILLDHVIFKAGTLNCFGQLYKYLIFNFVIRTF